MTYSRTTILARLGRDAETRYTQSNVAVTEMSIAFDYRVKDASVTNWTRLTVWGKQAEWLRNSRKGDLILAEGVEYRVSVYEKDGEEKRFHGFETTYGSNVINLTAMMEKREQDDQRTPASERSGEENQDPDGTLQDTAGDLGMDDDDLPF